MAEPPVPSSSSSLSRGWTFRVIHLQYLELTLKTCAPKPINAVTFCTSTMMGASLEHPTSQAIVSDFKNGTVGVASCGSVHWAIFILASLGLGLGWECEGPIVGWGICHWWGLATFPQFLLGWIKANAVVGHSLAIWPHPWHLKHWTEWVSVTSYTIPLTLGLQLPWSQPWLPVPSTPCPVGRLWTGIIWPGPPLPLWEFGQLGVLLPLYSHPWPHSQGLPGALEGLLPCLVWVRVTINLAICCLSLAIPSPGSVVTKALALPFSQVSSF